MKIIKIEIDEKLNNKDIKFILFSHLKLTSKLVTKLKIGNGIMLNDKKETVRKIVKTGDVLTVTLPEQASLNIVPNDIPLNILYEDEEILVVNKPQNMPTHPSQNHFEGTLANAVMYYFKDTDFTFRAVNRLDKDTTGIVIIAKNQYSANILSEQIKNRKIKKEYLAICVGKIEQENGIIEVPIKREKESVIKRIVAEDGSHSKTEYNVLKYENGYSLLRLIPHTGRTHQLRVHMAYLGYPLYADYLYGKEISGERTRLHCSSLTIIHPITKEEMKFVAPTPDDFFITYD